MHYWCLLYNIVQYFTKLYKTSSAVNTKQIPLKKKTIPLEIKNRFRGQETDSQLFQKTDSLIKKTIPTRSRKPIPPVPEKPIPQTKNDWSVTRRSAIAQFWPFWL